jgi:hypothetical protein
VSALVTVTPGKFHNRARRSWQTIKVTNVVGTPLSGPLTLVLDHLCHKVRLLGTSGGARAAGGSPAVGLNLEAADVLSPGASVTLVLQFANPSGTHIRYSWRVLAG